MTNSHIVLFFLRRNKGNLDISQKTKLINSVWKSVIFFKIELSILSKSELICQHFVYCFVDFFYYLDILFMLSKVVAPKWMALCKNLACRASFDCDGCRKKIDNPECNACDKMINYFNVFSM